ncbi:MAG: hypothetical protein QOD05_1295 [Microbacteriaceae bacterium]|nr:hypothetical protein [Microbacteriaceae bacterium]
MREPLNLRQVFDDLVRLETDLWNTIDARLTTECGVTLGTFNVLLIISETPACRVNDLAAALSITVGGVSQAVDRIEAKGLLVRLPNPANRRSSLLELTSAGWQALESSSAVFDAELSVWFDGPLADSRAARFAEDLTTLRAAAVARRATSTSSPPPAPRRYSPS